MEVDLMVSIPVALVTAIGLCYIAFTIGYAWGEEKVRRIVSDHRDAMNAKFNAMKLEAQEKLREEGGR